MGLGNCDDYRRQQKTAETIGKELESIELLLKHFPEDKVSYAKSCEPEGKFYSYGR